MSSNNWPYTHTTEQVAINVGSLAVGAATAYALSTVFNPVALGAAAVYGTYKIAQSYGLIYSSTYQKYLFKKFEKSGVLVPATPEQSEKIRAQIEEINQKFGRKEAAPELYIANEEFVVKTQFPIIMRALLGKNLCAKIIQPSMHKVFAAMPGANKIIVSKAALESYKKDKSTEELRENQKAFSKEEIDFVLAHELAHLKTDDHFSFLSIVKSINKNAMRFLMLATAVTAGAGLFGVALPLTLGFGTFSTAAAIVGISMGSVAGINFFSRIRERRADRNAVHITRNPEAADSFLSKLHDFKQPSRRNIILTEAFNPHPCLPHRLESLKQEWDNIVQHPAPVTQIAAPPAAKPAGP